MNIFQELCAEADRLKGMTPEEVEADAAKFRAEVRLALATIRKHGRLVPDPETAEADSIDQAEIALSRELDEASRRRRLGIES